MHYYGVEHTKLFLAQQGSSGISGFLAVISCFLPEWPELPFSAVVGGLLCIYSVF